MAMKPSDDMSLQELRKQIALGLRELDQGESIPGEQVEEELREISRRRRQREARSSEG